MGDPGGTCGTAGVTAGGTGTGGEPGPAAGGGEPARKAGGATKGLGRKKTPRNMAFLRKASYCLFMVFSYIGFYVLKPNIEK